MRNEKEMLDLIINTANEDDRIRACYMEGSRVNPNVEKDIFQDYDIVYVVKETESFIKDKNWIDRFGKRLYMQYPDENVFFKSDKHNCYGWLMQFNDGNRLDLHVCTIEYVNKNIHEDKLFRVLLDKDKCLPEIKEFSDKMHFVKKPTEKDFICNNNEFWWCLNNVGKGLYRDEVPYVMDSINYTVRPCLLRLLSWYAASLNNYSISIGKCGKYLYKFVSKNIYDEYLKTYSGANNNSIWDSVVIMCNLYNKIALKLGENLGFNYNKEEAENSYKYLMHIKNLPCDAKEIY